jgi:hypothetical protein
MDLQAHEDLEALREPLRETGARHRAGSACGGKQVAFEAHVQISKWRGGKQKTRWLAAYRVLSGLRRPSLRTGKL